MTVRLSSLAHRGDLMSTAVLVAVVAVVATAVTVAFRSSLARRSAPAADGTAPPLPGRAGRKAAAGTGEPTPAADPNVWQSATVSDLSAAEALLNHAEAEGYQERELVILDNSTFLVRWRNQRA
jgi:hypothetical protein